MPIVLDARQWWVKTEAIGCTIDSVAWDGGRRPGLRLWSVSLGDLCAKPCYFALDGKYLGEGYGHKGLILSLAIAEHPESFRIECEPTLNILIVPEGPADVVHRYAAIRSVRVFNKADPWHWDTPAVWSDIDKDDFWRAPDGMKLGLYHNPWALPYRPSKNAIPAGGRDTHLDDIEALAIRRAAFGLAGNVDGQREGVAHDLPREADDVGLDQLRRIQ